jgi:hypothetical protein
MHFLLAAMIPSGATLAMMDRGEDDDRPDPKLALIQAGVSLALLIALPLLLDPPTTPWGVGGLVTASLLLLVFLAEGVARFVRSRRKPFADSILPPELERRNKPPRKPEE